MADKSFGIPWEEGEENEEEVIQEVSWLRTARGSAVSATDQTWGFSDQDGGEGVQGAHRVRDRYALDIHQLLQVQPAGARCRRHGAQAAGCL